MGEGLLYTLDSIIFFTVFIILLLSAIENVWFSPKKEKNLRYRIFHEYFKKEVKGALESRKIARVARLG